MICARPRLLCGLDSACGRDGRNNLVYIVKPRSASEGTSGWSSTKSSSRSALPSRAFANRRAKQAGQRVLWPGKRNGEEKESAAKPDEGWALRVMGGS